MTDQGIFDLTGKVVLITGGSRGLGKACAEAVAAFGATTVIAARDQEKIDEVFEKFIAEDPTLIVREDDDTGQTILSGMGELHLEVIISRMQREFRTNVNVGKPQVVYRETIEKQAAASAVFDKEVAGQRLRPETEQRLRYFMEAAGRPTRRDTG